MSTVDDRVKAGAQNGGDVENPPRRPIPLPPASLRPPPRARRRPSQTDPAADAPPKARVGPAGRRGARRGFVLGFLLPVVGLGVAGFLWWQNHSEEAATSELQVRARMEGEPRGLTAAREPDPGPAKPGSTDPDPAERPGKGVVAGADTPVAGAGEVLSIQVASFRTRGRAERVLAEAKARTGLEGLIIPARVDGVRWYRILLGAFAAPEDALGAAGPLLEDGMITEVLVRPVPERWIPVLTGGEGSS